MATELVNVHYSNQCPYCNGQLVQMDHELTCTSCGTVIEPTQYVANPPRVFTPEEITIRSHYHIHLPYQRTEFDPAEASSHQAKFYRLRKLNYTGNQLYSRQFNVVRAIINKFPYSHKIKLNLLLTIARMFKPTMKIVCKQRQIFNVLGGLLFLACRQLKLPVTLPQIVEMFEDYYHKVQPTSIRALLQKLNVVVPSLTVKDYLPYVNGTIENDFRIRSKLQRTQYDGSDLHAALLQPLQFYKMHMEGRNPLITAAAIAYLKIQRRLTKRIVSQNDLERLFNISSISIRTHLRELYSCLKK